MNGLYLVPVSAKSVNILSNLPSEIEESGLFKVRSQENIVTNFNQFYNVVSHNSVYRYG